jgi:hypothetical protein
MYDLYMLIEVIERRSPVTNRKSVVYVLKCEACDKLNEGCKVRYERSVMHFCNNKCRGKYKHDHPETWKKAIEALNSAESHAKAKATIGEKAARGEWRHWLGKHHTEETRKHLSEVSKGDKRAGANNGMFGRKHSEETRAKMSEKKAIAAVEGRLRFYGTCNKKGWYKSSKTEREHFFKSSWEEAVMKHLDVDDSVKDWDYECVRIPYVYGAENRQRWYVPDFVITRVDGAKEMWEVKPSQFAQTERVLNTSAAGQAYCEEHNIEYTLVTEHTLKMLGII